MSVKLRPLKAIVAVMLVSDDGETLVEHPIQPQQVQPSEFATFFSEKLPEQIAKLEEQMNK